MSKNIKKSIGISIITTLFIALFYFLSLEGGWIPVLKSFGITAIIVLIFWIGVYLIISE